MAIASVDQYSERQHRALQRILERMTISDQRAEPLYKRQRQFDRRQYQGVTLICLPTSECPEPSEDHPTTFQAWTYNLSQGGMGFVSPAPIVDDQVSVGLKLPTGAVRWMTGRIVRSRQIPEEEFFDYGVAFIKPNA